jgi:hypothetical protein
MIADVVELDDCLAEISSDDYSRRRPCGAPADDDGGNVEDVLKRLGAVELDMKTQLSALAAVMPHLATKSDIGDLKAELSSSVGSLRAEMTSEIGSLRAEMTSEIGSLRAEMTSEIGSLRAEMTGEIGSLRAEMTGEISSLRAEMKGEIGALRAESKGEIGSLRADLGGLETRIIKWMIATALTSAGLAFSIAKFVH